MFTLEQIKGAHSKVKSGSDFPAYIQDMKLLDVKRYEHYVSDAHIDYLGKDGHTLSSDSKWTAIVIAELPDTEKLKQSLTIHQQGQTDYPAFCRHAAEAGVEKWVVDIDGMTCTYCDKEGRNMLVESIPQP